MNRENTGTNHSESETSNMLPDSMSNSAEIIINVNDIDTTVVTPDTIAEQMYSKKSPFRLK